MKGIPTPKYIIDFSKFRNNCYDIMNAFDREWDDNTIYGYSVKTNRDAELIKFAYEKLGWYIEMVSPDEYYYCSKLGIPKNRMILNGPCKENMIINDCPKVSYLNLDNLDEVRSFCCMDYENINVGLRINFDLESVCPQETTAGLEVSRFGIDADSSDLDEAIMLLNNKNIEKIGLHLHTSTKTRSLNVFEKLAKKALEISNKYKITFSFIDIGGGFFGGQKVTGKPTMNDYAKVICNELKKGFNPKDTKLILEPGASVLATCTSYLTSVINIREIRGTKVITLDGTLLHINPFMINRNQPFKVIDNISGRKIEEKQIICGSTCMENDRFTTIRHHECLLKGDVIEFHNVGAYTMAFNSYFILNPPKVEYIGG